MLVFVSMPLIGVASTDLRWWYNVIKFDIIEK